MEERFVIKRKDFKKLERYAENIYNTAVVIDYFCSSQKEYEELYNLAPIVKNLRKDADQVLAFFINYRPHIFFKSFKLHIDFFATTFYYNNNKSCDDLRYISLKEYLIFYCLKQICKE